MGRDGALSIVTSPLWIYYIVYYILIYYCDFSGFIDLLVIIDEINGIVTLPRVHLRVYAIAEQESLSTD